MNNKNSKAVTPYMADVGLVKAGSKYSEDQERDEAGRFAGGGGGSDSGKGGGDSVVYDVGDTVSPTVIGKAIDNVEKGNTVSFTSGSERASATKDGEGKYSTRYEVKGDKVVNDASSARGAVLGALQHLNMEFQYP